MTTRRQEPLPAPDPGARGRQGGDVARWPRGPAAFVSQRTVIGLGGEETAVPLDSPGPGGREPRGRSARAQPPSLLQTSEPCRPSSV